MSNQRWKDATLGKFDVKEFEHLSEKERMIAGYPYKPGDKELVEGRLYARQEMSKFNTSHVDDKEGRRAILRDLLNQECRDNRIFIEPPFKLDYGIS